MENIRGSIFLGVLIITEYAESVSQAVSARTQNVGEAISGVFQKAINQVVNLSIEGFAERVRLLSIEGPFRANAGILQYCVDMTFGTMIVGLFDFLTNVVFTVGKVAGAGLFLVGVLFGVILFNDQIESGCRFGAECCTKTLQKDVVGIFESLLRIPPVVGPILNNFVRDLVRPSEDEGMYV